MKLKLITLLPMKGYSKRVTNMRDFNKVLLYYITANAPLTSNLHVPLFLRREEKI